MAYASGQTGQTHVPEYEVTSSIDDGHYHRAAGVSGLAVPDGSGHVHEVAGWTTYDDRHLHPYRFRTGPPIPVAGGDHVHYLDGPTAVVDGHAPSLAAATAAAGD